MMLENKLVNWFVPAGIRGRTNVEMARIFVFTHLFGPVIAQPMAIYLYFVSPEINFQLQVMVAGIYSFLTLPFVLKYTGSMKIASLLSFVGLAAVSLFGTYHYGGFSSPFLPWLIVSLLLGFFYLSKNTKLVMGLFTAIVGVFLTFLLRNGLPSTVPVEDLRILSWLSIVAATVYMSWMALYYARIIALRSELQHEAERFRATMEELEKARAVSEEVSRHRSLFFAKMSHELRTPLNVIIGYSDIMLDDAKHDGGNTQTVSDLERINKAGKHLLSLVSEVLDTDKIVNDVNAVDVSTFTLGDLIDEVVASALPLVVKNGNKFDIDCNQRQASLHSDRTKLRQMLINLLSNAGKFTKNGTVSMKLSVDNGIAGDRFHVEVSDTGIGIAADALPKLFQSYIQADSTISSRFGGTGIGLAITRKFAVLLGGEITVTSKPEKGSQFVIDLPARVEAVRKSGGENAGTADALPRAA